ncbi:MAG: hypothetical protein Edafosvirus3_46 [Edafosvirus sp.]|uniref:Uncharacterized protein n=1 Tax=Edafosvirus sp. TaxID=2487765 RepID=A0A3G4ZSV5_9VIRU|nr:MAG: hypothetical protein Edafosvirus3_46 [Edafosvirus sp.]
MVNSAGQKRAQPENDPHHIVMNYVVNKNKQKYVSKHRIDYVNKDFKQQYNLNNVNYISGTLTFSRTHLEKLRSCQNNNIVIPLATQTHVLDHNKKINIMLDDKILDEKKNRPITEPFEIKKYKLDNDEKKKDIKQDIGSEYWWIRRVKIREEIRKSGMSHL